MGGIDFSQLLIDCLKNHSSYKLDEAEWLMNNVTIDVNAKDKEGRGGTALIQSAYYGLTQWTEKLLKAGAHVNAKDDYGRTALWYASLYGHTDIAMSLVKAGADVHVKDCDGTSPIILSTQFKTIDMCRLYLGQGANINDQDERNYDTPLTVAASSNPTFEKFEFLLNHGADAMIKNKRGKTALDIVRVRQDVDGRIVSLLQQHMEPIQNPVQIIRSTDNAEHMVALYTEHTRE